MKRIAALLLVLLCSLSLASALGSRPAPLIEYILFQAPGSCFPVVLKFERPAEADNQFSIRVETQKAIHRYLVNGLTGTERDAAIQANADTFMRATLEGGTYTTGGLCIARGPHGVIRYVGCGNCAGAGCAIQTVPSIQN